MHFAYTIIYVPEVAASLSFFEKAFGCRRRFLDDSGMYGELDTGATTLAFAAHEMGTFNYPGGHVEAHTSVKPLGFEVAFVTDDVFKAHAHALQSGAAELAAPAQKPWGQTVSYLRCPDGIMVELCTALPV
ncbi:MULTISPECIES: VOC family protein [unclassified Undibacterium]|uniref:VOC family protein n=1 Tax=unclassified Undibacterium TaxID=2630295 RepID=UPI003C2F3599